MSSSRASPIADRVSSLADRQALASVSRGEIRDLGWVDGAFGVLLSTRRFHVFWANDPMVVEYRHISTDDRPARVAEIGREVWIETVASKGARVELLPVPEGGG